jgi:hypothetical protein
VKTISLSSAEIALLRDVLCESIDSWADVRCEDDTQMDAQIDMAWDIIERLY